MRNLIIYGGTFDPIHNGHVKTALNVQQHFNFDRFVFLPCKIPVLKNQALATPLQRVEMIELALTPYIKDENFQIDLSEITRDSSSYTVESLLHFRKQFGKKMPITLLMGRDSFNQLPSWHKWERLLTLANILVINRVGSNNVPETEPLKNLVQTHQTQDECALVKQTCGLIYSFDAGTYDFSSSWIREQIKQQANLHDYLAEPVIKYIQKNQLYF